MKEKALRELVDTSNLLYLFAHLSFEVGGLIGHGFSGRIQNCPMTEMGHKQIFKLIHYSFHSLGKSSPIAR
jgi:hypothetical protein